VRTGAVAAMSSAVLASRSCISAEQKNQSGMQIDNQQQSWKLSLLAESGTKQLLSCALVD
jgi:hypothetical protein